MGMMRRVRAIQYVVSPQLVVDDGDTLSPLDVQPIVVPASQWASFAEHGLADALGELQARFDAPAEQSDEANASA